ncbi:3220_t:CDS:2 [Scutellospora calospora]|uniref:3220_t:CDS:1 n=1 Tax=Scutellospora calospora TaxID=85575 RepID=A0ACA9LGM8_9GLOM|nr:3220_t:CDS:2 [Scutellospora calospora]
MFKEEDSEEVFSDKTGVSSLRRHLNEHNINALARCQATLNFSRTDSHNDDNQKRRDKKLII